MSDTDTGIVSNSGDAQSQSSRIAALTVGAIIRPSVAPTSFAPAEAITSLGNLLRKSPSAGDGEPVPMAYALQAEEDDTNHPLLGIPLESGARIVSEAEVKWSTGTDLAQWITAAEAELKNSFQATSAYTETTPDELREVGGYSKVLPMTTVWSIKSIGVCKCRAVA